MSIVRIGIIGCATIARRYIVPAILSLKDQFELSGVASRTMGWFRNKNQNFGMTDALNIVLILVVIVALIFIVFALWTLFDVQWKY